MATETQIPEFVCLKKGEMEDTAWSSELLITEIPENKVKQLETSNQVAEIVNTQLETGKPTNESGTFFHSLSVPMVNAGQHSELPDSCETTTVQDQEESKTANVESFTEAVSTQTEPDEGTVVNEEKKDEKATEKTESEEGLELLDSKKEGFNMLEKDRDDKDGVTVSQDATYEDIKETMHGQDATTLADFKEQDLNEKPKEFLKEETEDKVIDAQEASEECENGAKEKGEQKPEESVKKIEQEEEIAEIRPTVEIEEKLDEEEATQRIDGQKEKSDSPLIKEVSEETDSEKAEYQEKEPEVNILEKDQGKKDVTFAQDLTFEKGLQVKNHHSVDEEREVVQATERIKEDTEEIRNSIEIPEKMEQVNVIPTDVYISTQTEPKEETTENEEKNDDGQTKESESPLIKEICDSSSKEPNENDISSKGQSGGNDVPSSQTASNEDIKETTGQPATTVAYFKEGQNASVMTKEILGEEAEDKSNDTQEATEQYADETNNNGEQKPEESVNKIVDSYSKQEENTEEVKPSVETNEEEKHGIIQGITTEACISTPTESQVKTTELEEEVTESDGGQKENPENLLIKEVSEETESEKPKPEVEELSDNLSKDKDQTKEQELSVSEQDQGEDDVTCSQDVTSTENLQAKNYDSEGKEPKLVETRESVDEDTEEIKSTIEIKENTETKPREDKKDETTEIGEKNEEAIENEDDQEKSEIPLVKEVCEATSPEKTESEEATKQSDSYSTKMDENEIVSKEETAKKEQELIISEVQGGEDDVISSKNISNEDIKETKMGKDATNEDYFEGQNVSEMTEEIIGKEAEDNSIDAQEDENEAKDKREKKPDDIVNKPVNSCPEIVVEKFKEDEANASDKKDVEDKLDAENQADRTDEMRETKDEVISTEISSELGQPKEENVEEIKACLTETMSENREDEITNKGEGLSHDKIEDENDNTSTEENKILDGRTREIEISTLEHEPVEEQNCGLDEVSNENFIDLNEREAVEPQEDITPPIVLETSTEDTTKSEKENAESESVPTDDLKSVSEAQIHEVVPTSEESNLKEESLISATVLVNEDEGTVTKEILSDERTEPTTEIKQETFKEVCEKASSEKAELEHSDSSNIEISEKKMPIYNDETKEKDQEVDMSAKDQGKDKVTTDVCSSPSAELKEETTEDEEKNEEAIENDDGLTKKPETPLVKEARDATSSEVENRSTDAQEGKNGAKDKSEQKPDDNVNEPVNSCPEIIEENIKEDEGDNKEIEAKLDAENQADRTEDRSEMKDEVISTEKMPSEVGQPKEENVDEIQACLTETISEKREDEITEKGEDLSHERIEDTNDNTTAEEKIFLDRKTRENEISTLEHEQVEEQNCGLDEVSKENFTDLKETTAVEPQEDIMPSIVLETSPEDTSNSENAKIESGSFPKDDLESVSEVQIPEVVPPSEESNLKEECLGSATTMHVDEEKETVTKEISSDEKKEQTTEIKQETFEELCEETSSEKAELEEGLKLSDSSNMEINEKAMPTFNDEGQEKDQEVNMSIQGSESEFVKTKESVDEDAEEIKSSVGTKENTEQQGLLHVITTDVCSSEPSEPKKETIENEEKNDEALENDDYQTKKPEIPLVKEVCEVTSSEVEDKSIDAQQILEAVGETTTINPEEITEQDLQDSQSKTNKEIEANIDAENQAERTEEKSEMKDEVIATEKFEEIQACLTTTKSENTEDEITKEGEEECSLDGKTSETEISTLKQEPVEEQDGGIDEVSMETYTGLNETKAVEPQEDITVSNSLKTSTEDTANSEKEKAESENLPIDDLESVSEVRIPEVVPVSEESTLKEECLISVTTMDVDEEKGTVTKEISSDEKTEQTTEIKQEMIEEVCGETSSEKAELEEGLNLSDSSNVEINEKAMTTFNDEAQEKDQEDMSIESQSKDIVTSSREAAFEEDLQEKSYQTGGNESEFVTSNESVDEDIKEIQSSVETKNNESESPLFEEVCEATSSEKVEPDDGAKHTDSFNMKLDEDEIVSKDENLEKELELTMSEVQGGGDNVTGSENVPIDDIKETTIGVSAVTKEILGKEAEDKSYDAQEASKQCENSANDETEQKPEESVNKPVNSWSETIEGNVKEDEVNKKEIEAKLAAENQDDRTEDKSEMKDEVVTTEKMPSELGQPKEQNVEEIQACLTTTTSEKIEEEITEKDENLSNDNKENTNDSATKEEKCTLEHGPVEEQDGGVDEVSKEKLTELNEITTVEPQQDIKEDTSNSEKAIAESENLPIEDLESVSEIQIPEMVPKSEDSAIATYVDEEKVTATEEISSDEQLEKSYITTEENVTQVEQIGENDSPHKKRDKEEAVTQETQLNTTEDCNEMVKDVILTEEIEQVPLVIQKEKDTNDFKEQIVEEDSYAQNPREIAKEISYSDPVPVGNPQVAEVRADAQIEQEDLTTAEDISCESKVKDDLVDEAPKEETIRSLEDVAIIEPQVENLPTQAQKSVCDVQTPEVIADSEAPEVKEECNVLATSEYTDENKVEEDQKNITSEISSEPTKSDEEKSGDLKEKAFTEENLGLHEELNPTSELAKDDQVNEIKPKPEQSNIPSENITNDQILESKLEHTSEKDFKDGKEDIEEDVTLAPETQSNSTENQNETMKNVILTDKVAVETENEQGINKVKGQVSEEDNCPTELDKPLTSNKKDLGNEMEYSKPVPVGNTEVTEVKAESQIELDNIQAAEDPSCLSKETIEEKGVLISQLTDEEVLEAPALEFEEKEKDTELISELQTPEPVLKMETEEEHPEATNDMCETLKGGELNDKLMDEPKKIDAKEDIEVIDDGEKKESYQDDVAKVMVHERLSQTEEKLVSMVPREEPTSPKAEDQTSEVAQNKDAKIGNEVVEDVSVNEVLLGDETAKESRSIKDNINEEAIHNQQTSATDEVCQIEKLSSSPNELLETKDSVEDPKLIAENLKLKDETSTDMKGPNEDSETVAPELESLENMVTEETLEKTHANDPTKTTSDSLLSSTDQDIEVRSEESREHDDIVKIEEKPTEVFKPTSEVAELVPEGRETSKSLIEDLQEASLAKHDPEITTTTEKIEDEIKDEELACLVEKTREFQVSTLNSETDEDKQNGPGDMQNKEREAVQPQESSEDNTLLSQNDKKTEDPLVVSSTEKEIIQSVDTRFEEAPVINVNKHEKGLDLTTQVKSIDVVSNAECSVIEQPRLDTKEGTSEFVNQENQKEQKKEANENIEAAVPVEDVRSSTREADIRSVDLEVQSAKDATVDKAYSSVDPNNKMVAEKGVINDNEDEKSKPTEEASGMKQEQLELDAPVILDTAATEDLKISQKYVTDDLIKGSQTQPEIQKYEVSARTVDMQSPHGNESKLLTEKTDASHEQEEPTAKSLTAELVDLKATSTEPQRSTEVSKEEKKTGDEKEKSESAEPTKGNSEVVENVIAQRELTLTKDQQVDKEEIGDSGVKTDEENEDNEKMVMVEASKDMEFKVQKKSHNILSGVGSKVKHSIAKVKKAITGGKSTITKRERDQLIT